eukprot:5536104-Amphidinium_carterae.1
MQVRGTEAMSRCNLDLPWPYSLQPARVLRRAKSNVAMSGLSLSYVSNTKVSIQGFLLVEANFGKLDKPTLPA